MEDPYTYENGKITRLHGQWLPTPYLRYFGPDKVLQQKMRRRLKYFPNLGAAYTAYEYEWQAIIHMMEEEQPWRP